MRRGLEEVEARKLFYGCVEFHLGRCVIYNYYKITPQKYDII